MYLSQVFSSKNQWVYSAFCIIFFIFLFPNPENAKQQAKEMQKLITEMGELPFYAFSLASFGFFLLILLSIVILVHQQSFTQFTTSRKKIDFKRFFFSITIFGGISTLAFLVEYLMYPSDYVWNFQLIPFLILAIISILLLPIQIGFEEYFFRGYFMQWTALLSKNRWVPLFSSSILFGLMHIANPEVGKMGYGFLVFYISMGFLLGIMTLMDDGLELALGIHFSNNLFASLITTSSWSALQTPSLFKQINPTDLNLITVFSLLICYALVLFIFAKKYHWNNWKEKLLGKINHKPIL